MTAWQPMRWMTGGACTTRRFGPSETTISWTVVIRKEPSRMAAASRSMMSFLLPRRKAFRLSFFKSPSTSSKLALMFPCSMIASMMFPYRFIAFRSLWLVTFTYSYQQHATVFLFRSSLTRIAEAQTTRPCQWRHVAVVEERLRPIPR